MAITQRAPHALALVRLALAASFVLGGFVPAAHAQQPQQTAPAAAAAADDEELDAEEQRTAGWLFTPGARAGVMWDSGIDTTQNVVVESLFQSWVGIFSPSGDLTFRGRRTQFDAGYAGSIERYWGSNTNWEQRGRVGVRRAITRRFSAAADASYTAAPTSDRLELTEAIVPYVEVDSTWSTFGGSLQYQTGARTAVDLAYRFERVGIDRPLDFESFGLLRSGHSHIPSFGLMHRFSERLGLGARAEYRAEFVSGLDHAFNVTSVTGEFSYALTRLTSLTAGGGVSRLRIVTFDTFTTAPVFHAGVGHETRRVTIDAHYSRAFQPLFGFGTMASTHTFAGGATFPLDDDRLYYVEGVIAYNRTKPVEELGVGFDFDSLWTTARIGRRLNQWVSGEAFVEIASQSAQRAVWPGANRHRIGMQVVMSRPMRMQ